MADTEHIVGLIKEIPLFQSLKRRQLDTLARIFVERRCQAGEMLVPQDQSGYGFFVITAGSAKAIRRRSDGSEVVVNTFGPGDFFGEIALLDGGPRTASVIATEPIHCLVLPRENFLSALRRDGDMAVAILIELTRRFRSSLDAC